MQIAVSPARNYIQRRPGEHSVALSVVLGALCITGTGQMANGQVAKGVAILLASMVLSVVTMGLAMLVIWPACLVDVCLIAIKINRGQPVGLWEFF